jgi:hypothetical protein
LYYELYTFSITRLIEGLNSKNRQLNHTIRETKVKKHIKRKESEENGDRKIYSKSARKGGE